MQVETAAFVKFSAGLANRLRLISEISIDFNNKNQINIKDKPSLTILSGHYSRISNFIFM